MVIINPGCHILFTILYVDDEPGLLEVGKLFLEQNGQFNVDTILSAQAALTRISTKNYDAIVSDYQMPDMDGIETLRRFKEIRPNMPVIMITGTSRSRSRTPRRNSRPP